MTFEEQFTTKNLNKQTTKFKQALTFTSPRRTPTRILWRDSFKGEGCNTLVILKVLLSANSRTIISCEPNWAKDTNQLENKSSTKSFILNIMPKSYVAFKKKEFAKTLEQP
jgi:hypothetical protein